MKFKKNKGAQSEMVGFILIVILVVVAAMIFLLVSLINESDTIDSVEVENLISSMMEYTTECAVVFEPDYDNLRDLIKSCYDNDLCSNLNKMTCDYLDESVSKIIEDVMKTESKFNTYQLDILIRDSDTNVEEELIPRIVNGNCTGGVSKAQNIIHAGSRDLVFRLALCG